MMVAYEKLAIAALDQSGLVHILHAIWSDDAHHVAETRFRLDVTDNLTLCGET